MARGHGPPCSMRPSGWRRKASPSARGRPGWPPATRGPKDPQAWLELAEAERLMYADRDAYVGDPAFVRVPLAGMLDAKYLDERARLIGDHAGPAPAPGHPPGAPAVGADATAEPG